MVSVVYLKCFTFFSLKSYLPKRKVRLVIFQTTHHCSGGELAVKLLGRCMFSTFRVSARGRPHSPALGVVEGERESQREKGGISRNSRLLHSRFPTSNLNRSLGDFRGSKIKMMLFFVDFLRFQLIPTSGFLGNSFNSAKKNGGISKSTCHHQMKCRGNWVCGLQKLQ